MRTAFVRIKKEAEKPETGGRAMLKNVCSTTERVVRVIIGLAILSLMYFLRDYGAVRYWGLVGLIPIATAVVKYCPISHALGINTCAVKRT
jgi:Inner membrane protein YgaP-like, transmembrane domain